MTKTFLSLLFFAGRHVPLHLGFVSPASALLFFFSSLFFAVLPATALLSQTNAPAATSAVNQLAEKAGNSGALRPSAPPFPAA
jgi:hypothetical protein